MLNVSACLPVLDGYGLWSLSCAVGYKIKTFYNINISFLCYFCKIIGYTALAVACYAEFLIFPYENQTECKHK